MPVKAVQVSLDLDLLERVDAEPEVRQLGRSSFVREALHFYLEAKRRHAVDAAIRTAYAGEDDALLAQIEPLLAEQAWPED